MLSNASLFRRTSYAEDLMMRGAMPRTAARERAEAEAAARELPVEKIAKPLTYTMADAMAVVNG